MSSTDDAGSSQVFVEMSQSCGLVLAADDWLTFEFVIFDNSSSMDQFGSAPRDALFGAFSMLRSNPKANRIGVSLDMFSDQSRTVIQPCFVAEARLPEVIRPYGNTLLYRTVLDVLKRYLPSYLEAVKRGYHANVKVSVYTDGADNLSTNDDKLELQQIAAEAQKAGWELFITAFDRKLDAKKIAQEMGFPDDDMHAVTMAASAQSVHEATARSATHTIRTTGIRPSTMFPSDPPSSPRRR